MNARTCGEYTRITKTAARARWAAGLPVHLCPVNLNPESPWGLLLEIAPDFIGCDGKTFDQVTNAATAYNCNAETGRYLAYYVKKTDKKPLIVTTYDPATGYDDKQDTESPVDAWQYARDWWKKQGYAGAAVYNRERRAYVVTFGNYPAADTLPNCIHRH